MLKNAALLAGVFLAAACSTSPTGRSQLTLLPGDQLARMGLTSFDDMKQEKTVENDPGVNRYVRCVAGAITDVLDDEQDWEVVVFDDDSANAFALPGGKIGVHTGLLKVARNADQLAAVLGHEVGHVLSQHANERMSQGLLAQVAATGVAVAVAGSGGSDSNSKIAASAAFGLAQYGVLLPYSRSHESEADVIGQSLMARAGFDPRQSVTLWQNMKASGGPKPPELLSSHPAPDTRIRDLGTRMDDALALYEQARAAGRRPRC